MQDPEDSVSHSAATVVEENFLPLTVKNYAEMEKTKRSWWLNWSAKTQPTIRIRESLLHRRLQHVGKNYLRKLVESSPYMHLSHKLPATETYMGNCECCAKGKMKALPVPKGVKAIPDDPGDMIFADLKPFPREIVDVHGNNQLLVLVDAATRFTMVEALPNKLQGSILAALTKMSARFKRVTGFKMKILQPDDEAIFTNCAAVTEWVDSHGVELRPSPPHKHARNGVVERTIGLLWARVRCMHKDLGVPDNLFVSDAAEAACYVKNLTPTEALGGLSSFTRITGKAPPIHHLRVWGSKVLVRIGTMIDSLADRCREGILVGYGKHNTLQTYKVYIPETDSFIYSEDFVIYEDRTLDLAALQAVYRDDKDYATGEEWKPEEEESAADTEIGTRSPAASGRPRRTPRVRRTLIPGVVVGVDPQLLNPATHDMTHKYRARVLDAYAGDRYRVQFLSDKTTHVVDGKYLLTLTRAAVMRTTQLKPTMGYSRAMKTTYASHFRRAMFREWKNLQVKFEVLSQEYFLESSLPAGTKIIDMLWNMEYKPERVGEKQFRARCLARGDQENKMGDVITYSPTATKESLRLLLHMAIQRDWKIHALDISNAFLNTEMSDITESEPTYFRVPVGLHKKGYVVKKLRNIYGLATAPRYWYLDLKKRFATLGYHPSEFDECLYLRHNKSGKLVAALVVHVDDILAVGNHTAVTSLINRLQGELGLEIRDLGENPESYLGLEMEYKKGELKIHQRKYVEFIANKFLTPEQLKKKVATPLPHLLKPSIEGEVNESLPYRSLVGALLYVAVSTRPDLAFPLMHLSRFLCAASQNHYDAAIRVLQYAYHTRHRGPRITRTEDATIRIYADADLGNDHSMKSTTGYVVMIGNTTLTWGSKLQTTISQSTLEAEYGALNTATKEGLFIRNLVETLTNIEDLVQHVQGTAGILQTSGSRLPQIDVYCDNARLVDSLKSGSIIGSRAVRHLKLKSRWLREQLLSNGVTFSHIKGTENPADLFTKNLAEPTIKKYINTMRCMYMST